MMNKSLFKLLNSGDFENFPHLPKQLKRNKF